MKHFAPMKALLLAVMLALVGAPVLAQPGAYTGTQRWQDKAGTFVLDSLLFSQGGDYVKICSLVAGTVNDTTTSLIDYLGAEHVSVKILSRSLNDNMNYKMYFRVSPDNASWTELTTLFTVANTKGGQVGGSGNTGRDTTTFILYDVRNTGGDTVVTMNPSHTGTLNNLTTTVNGADMRQMRANRFLQIRLDPGASAGDTSAIKVMATRIYPLNPSY